jgi:hypothetical protein
MLLAVVNKSRLISDADVQTAIGACAKQVRLHLAPLWDMVPAPVILYDEEEKAPKGADLLVILSDPGHAHALGFHRQTPRGKPYCRVFVAPVLNHGGSLLKGQLSVSATLSHEVCEWLIDPYLNLWADGPEGHYPLEVCDPVQNDSYEIDGVAVSNFVTKRYYDEQAPKRSQFDWMRKLKAPFSMTEGGYLQVRNKGEVQTRYGARYPEWKREVHAFEAARTMRRSGVSVASVSE